MVFFGVDPGTHRTGYGVIQIVNSLIQFRDAGVIANRADSSLAEKLENIYNGISSSLSIFQPDCVAVEQAFYAKNVNTTLILGHARGVVLLAAQQRGIPIVEFSPREIKKCVVGNGNASKEQVAFMVKTMLCLKNENMYSDMSDALAVSICAFNHFPVNRPDLRGVFK